MIFFLDADVAVHSQTLGRALARFEADPGLTALFGSYDDQPAAPGFVSQYRNLLHHFVHQQGDFRDDVRPAHTFWTGCGTIRRDVFLEYGGFDPRLYPRPAIEDIELGYRLTRAGHRIVLARDVLATHCKRWTLPEMVRTDIFRRGVPWTLLIKRTGTIETDLNVKAGQKACVALTGLSLLAVLLSALVPWAGIGLPIGLAAIVGLEPRLLCVPGPPQRIRFRMRRPSPAPALLFLLRILGLDCTGLLAPAKPWQRRDTTEHARRTDPGVGSIPAPAGARRARGLSRWRARSR